MRVLHIVGTLSPAAGGPTEVIRSLIRWSAAEHSSEVATLDDPAAEFVQQQEFAVHAFGGGRARWYRPALLAWLRANRERFDAVIVHGLWEYTGWAARRAFAGRVPYAVFPHGMLDPYFRRAAPGKHLKKSLYWWCSEFWTLRAATRVLFTTETERELARETFWPAQWRPMVTPLGSALPGEDAATLIEAFYERVPELRRERPGERRFLLFLGRIDPKKGCDLLIEAFGRVLRRHPEQDLELVMAGPDALGWRQRLEELARAEGVEARVHWPGMLEGRAKWGALAACEAFVLPSHQENFGIAVVEAMAAGKAVLLSTEVNIAPVIESCGCGLVEADTLEGTEQLLERWLALTPEERAERAAAARRTFAAQFDMRQNTARILSCLQTQPPSAAAEALQEAS